MAKEVIIQVKVIPNSSQDKIIGFEGEVLKIKCRATPEKGKANASVIALLSKHYKVPKNSITIIRGKTDSRKVIKIETEGV